MTTDEIAEAVAVLGSALAALQASVPTQAGRVGAAFRYACGDLLAAATSRIATGAVFAGVGDCFDLAVTAGATLNGLLAVRSAMVAASPSGQPALYVCGICYCMAVCSEAKVLTATTFSSSDDALSALAVIGAAFDVALEWTADNRMPALYQDLLGASAAIACDLTTRAAPLPRLTSYALPRGTTSHALAYRLYGDANRADELRAEGKVIHPAFMPASGTALSD